VSSNPSSSSSSSSDTSSSSSSGSTGSGTGGAGGSDKGIWGLATGGGGCACEVGSSSADLGGARWALLALAVAMGRLRKRAKKPCSEQGEVRR
jgi:hypothetical protein